MDDILIASNFGQTDALDESVHIQVLRVEILGAHVQTYSCSLVVGLDLSQVN